MMDPRQWDALMSAARNRAATSRQKQRVIAVELPPRAAYRIGIRWAYLIDNRTTW